MTHDPQQSGAVANMHLEQIQEQTDKEAQKKARLEKEKSDLLASLASSDFTAMKTKVAAILNLYPHARNSDVALAIQYWETFQPEIYKASGILPKDLFKLERLHYIVRARAKIQNEYGLFQADEKIRTHRKHREEDMYESVIEDSVPRKVVHIFADETGKTQEFVMVAAVWVLTGRAIFTVTQAITEWQKKSLWVNREAHFAKFGKGDIETLADYLGIIQENREFLSFKAIAVEKSKTKRSIEEVVVKLHEHMLIQGAEHEILNNRIDLPRMIELSVDEEQSLDSFTLAEMKQRIDENFQRTYDGKLVLASAQTASSRKSPLVQLADIVAGALNRRLNHKGDRNYKDEMADMIIDKLGLTLNEGSLHGLDSAALFRV